MDAQLLCADSEELIDLMEASTRSTAWMGDLVKTDRQLQASLGAQGWVQEFLQELKSILLTMGRGFDLPAAVADTLDSFVEFKLEALHFIKRITTTRLILRHTFQLALLYAIVPELIHLGTLFDRSCQQLVRLLLADLNKGGKVVASLLRCID